MDSLRQQGEQLLSGREGEALRSLARTPEAQKLGDSPAAAALEKAALRGDAAGLQKALAELLSTPEGRAVAQSLGRLGHG